MSWTRAIAAAALTFVAVPAMADVKAGVDAWARGDWASAVREWQGPATLGDPDAQFNLGQAYKSGRGVPRDLAQAEALFKAAAASGHIQAADNYGLLLYQRGALAEALPFVQAAASRGDPRAQYYLGIAHFNGDQVGKDWVRAYALVRIAQQAGIEAATRSLTEMDKLVPLDQRQKGVALSAQIAAEAEATRARQLAALDLGGGRPIGALPLAGAARVPADRTGDNAVTTGSRPAPQESPRTAGADYARPAIAQPGPPRARTEIAMTPPRPAATPAKAPPAPTKPAPAKPTPAKPALTGASAAPKATGPWKIQLGAFAVAGNAEALWNRVKGRPELAGHARILDKGAKVTRLLAGGFATQEAAQAACRKLSGAGVSCLVTRS